MSKAERDDDLSTSDSAHKNREMKRSWLERMQQDSWQLELLISGISLYMIWESRHFLFLQEFAFSVSSDIGSDASFDPTTVFLMIFFSGSWAILITNQVLHIAGRALWVGAIGLRSVSADIDYSALHYHPVFEHFLRKRVGSFDDFIDRLERFCSVVFAYSYLLIFLFLGWMVCGILAMLILPLSPDGGFQGFRYVIYFIFFLFCTIYFFDFVTLGRIKRSKVNWIVKAYMPIYRVMGWITFSALYRPLLYNFLDHRYAKRLLKFSVPYMIVVFVGIAYLEEEGFPKDNFMAFDAESQFVKNIFSPLTVDYRYYDDLRTEWASSVSWNFQNNTKRISDLVIQDFSLSEYRVADGLLFIFGRLYESDGYYLSAKKDFETFSFWDSEYELWQVEALGDSIRQLRKELYKTYEGCDSCSHLMEKVRIETNQYLRDKASLEAERHLTSLKELFEISIDGRLVSPSLDCHYFRHPNASEQGLRWIVPVDSLDAGSHIINVKRYRYHRRAKKIMSKKECSLPFYVSGK